MNQREKKQDFPEVEVADGNVQPSENDQNLKNEDTKSEVSNETSKKEEIIRDLQNQIENLKDNWARERAEFSNYRKRMQLEIMRAKDIGIEEFSKSLFGVLDNLDMVLSSNKTDIPEIRNFVFGVEMIRDEFLRVLAQYSIYPSVSKGDKFNPFMMEAIDVENREDLNEEIVLEVYKKAYIRLDSHDKEKKTVLRLSSVKVGKPIFVNQNHSNMEKDIHNSNNNKENK